jgi:hypothetical protein
MHSLSHQMHLLSQWQRPDFAPTLQQSIGEFRCVQLLVPTHTIKFLYTLILNFCYCPNGMAYNFIPDIRKCYQTDYHAMSQFFYKPALAFKFKHFCDWGHTYLNTLPRLAYCQITEHSIERE